MKKKSNDRPLVAVVYESKWGSVGRNLYDAGADTIEIDTVKRWRKVRDKVDAVVFTGGGDVNPARYGARTKPDVWGVSKQRDELEFRIAQEVVGGRLPALGICRGHQLLNVAFGGTLHQHIDDFTTVSHFAGGHDVWLRRKSELYRAIKERYLHNVTTLHHQAIKRVGCRLVPIAWAEDGVIEAIESLPGHRPYVLGVQFHPELDNDSQAQAIFEHFLDMVKPDRLLPSEVTRTTKSASSTITTLDTYSEDFEYEEWLRLNTKTVEETSRQAKCDARCSFPPCRSPLDCEHYGDCAAEAVANAAVGCGYENEMESLLDNFGVGRDKVLSDMATMRKIGDAKRGNPRHHNRKGR